MGIMIGNIIIDLWLFILVIIIIIAFIILAINRGIAAHRLQIGAGRDELIGRTASVLTALEPQGMVLIEGERWTAILDSGKAVPGEEVIVNRVEGLKLFVNKKQ
jgi:membrane-bound ClpP family serine protease